MLFLMILAGFAFGIAFGYCVQRAGLCFAHGLGEIFMGHGKRIIRMFAVIFIITSIGFLAASIIDPEGHPLKTIGQIRGFGFYNVLAGMIFGAGIFLNGGCILGTMRQLGEGNLLYLFVFISFIPGMALVVYGIDPVLKGVYDIQKVLLPQLLNLTKPDYWYVTAALALACVVWFVAISKRRRRRSECSLTGE